MNKNIALLIAFIVVLGLGYWLLMGNSAAPAQQGAQTPTGTAPADGTPAAGSPVYAPEAEPAAFAARAALAANLGVSVANVAIVKVEAKTWNDACLGRANAGEMCAQATTNGYEVTLQSQNRVYVYRTDTTGAVVRADL